MARWRPPSWRRCSTRARCATCHVPPTRSELRFCAGGSKPGRSPPEVRFVVRCRRRSHYRARSSDALRLRESPRPQSTRATETAHIYGRATSRTGQRGTTRENSPPWSQRWCSSSRPGPDEPTGGRAPRDSSSRLSELDAPAAPRLLLRIAESARLSGSGGTPRCRCRVGSLAEPALGGGCGAPKGNRNALQHGHYTAAALRERAEIGELIQQSEQLLRSLNEAEG